MTGKQMCEFIVNSGVLFWYGPEMEKKSAEEIWNLSPTGELYHVYELYDAARLLVGIRDGILY